jgi:hypothetical protein
VLGASIKGHIPTLIAKHLVKANEGTTTSFVAPRVFPILKFDFVDLTEVNGFVKAQHES